MEPLPSGRWRATLPGPRVAGSSKTFAAKEDAQRWLRQHADRPKASGGTLGDWLATWATLQAAKVAPQAFDRDRQVIDRHVRPALADVRLAALTPIRVEQFLAKLHADGVSPSERKRAAVTLRKILNAAVAAGELPASPMAKVAIPKHKPDEARPVPLDRLAHLLWVARGWGWETGFRVWLDGGLRPGELFALEWDDIDLAAGTLQVRRSLDNLTRKIRPPKTARGRRTVPIGAATVAGLEAAATKSGIVFPDANGGHLRLSNFARNVFVPIVTAAGLDWVTPYTMRHTTASVLLAAGASIRAVADRLGHEDPALTLRVYAHVMPNDQRRATDAMWNLVESASPRPRHGPA